MLIGKGINKTMEFFYNQNGFLCDFNFDSTINHL
jgi:hypothetical protein